MKRRVLWAGLALLIGGALVVRLLYQPPEDAHERMHAQEADAQATIDALAELPTEQQLQALETYLSHQSPVAVRTAAVEAIARIDAPKARALLRAALRDFASPVRVRVAEMATRQPREHALELLIDCLADHDTEVRQSAINGVQRIGDRRAVSALIDILRDDPNEQTQQMAMGALRALTRQPFYARYTDPPAQRQQARQAWLRWWATAQDQIASLRPKPVHPTHTQEAPDLTLRTLDGETIALRRPPKPLLLNFWGTWCGDCQAELPHLIALHQRYADRVQFVGIAFDEPEGEQGLRRFCTKKGIRYPQVMGDERTRDAFDISGVPQTVLIDTQGRIRFWWMGARDAGTLERALQLLLQ
ncbi:MAG: HEAT repeat domain-containing protein [Fimbriimonadales bacterium]